MKKASILMIVLFVSVLFSESVFAEKIPAFARKYGFSCKTCHNPFPRLDEYAEGFAGAGFVEKEEPRSAYKDAGDDLLILMRDFPVGMRMDVYLQSKNKTAVTSDLKTPYILKFLSGGNIAPNIGYYMYFFFSERGEVAGIEDAYIHFNDLFGSDLDIMVGQFQVSDPLMKRELRLTFEDYELYKVKPGFSDANLTYDRGIMMTYGLPSHTDFSFQILNGNGKPEADEEKNYDTDSEKAFAFRVSQSLGFFRIGGFYYYAKEKFNNRENTINWFGPDFTIGNDKIEFSYQFLERKDDNPWFLSNPVENRIKSHIAELIYMPEADNSRWYTTLLYNRIANLYESVTANYTYVLRRNVKFMAEFTRDLENEQNRITFGFVTGF